jgi:hypothetical protein
MKEAQFLGSLLPSHPDLLLIIEAVREKYNLPPISPDDDPIDEIYLGDESVSLEEFRQEIKNRILENIAAIFPENFVKQYLFSKSTIGVNGFSDIDRFPEDVRPLMDMFFNSLKQMATPIYQTLNAQIESVSDMLYIYVLTGETQEVPSDWFGSVRTMPTGDNETVVIAMASEITNLDTLIQQLREMHRKTFGDHRPKITNTIVSTAYYMQLRRMGKKWDFIIEEYIRRNKFSMPRDRTSKRYFDIRRKHEKTLRKRIERSEKILGILVK